MHTGEADLGEDDYYGTAVNRCARLRSTAHGSQVLVSEATAGLAHEALPPGATLRDLGLQRLRHLAEPERVSQLLHPELPADFPALRTIDSVPSSLPHQVSNFVGREQEIAEVRALLQDTRLLILPDGPLWSLPLHALPVGDDEYLCDRLPVHYAPSATAFVEARRLRDGAEPGEQVLSLGDPDFSRFRLAGRATSVGPEADGDAETGLSARDGGDTGRTSGSASLRGVGGHGRGEHVLR